MKGVIDHKIHMKADLSRCPEKSADFEKIIMTIVMRMLNRKVKRTTIASEQKIENSNDICDVSVELSEHKLYYEIQKQDSPKYYEKIKDRDLKTDTETIIIPIKQLIKKYGGVIRLIREDIEPYIIEEK